MTLNKLFVGAIVVVIAIIALFAIQAPHKLGNHGLNIEDYLPGVRDNGGIRTALSFQLGTSGTAQVNQVSTTCSPIANVSIAATSSGYMYCTGVTGVTSADNVIAQIATSTANFTLTKDNFIIISAKASTTAGAIDFLVYNGTGAAAVPSAVGRAASTTSIIASH